MLTCEVCGRGPAEQATLRRHVGMLVLQRFYRLKPTLCREHGEQVAKEWLTKTLVQGWWGIISFFMNIVAVGTDIAALRKFRKLDAPRPAAQPQPVQQAAMQAPPAPGGFSS
jgi:uncharacterized iron-regulated membrane protein